MQDVVENWLKRFGVGLPDFSENVLNDPPQREHHPPPHLSW